MANCLWRMDGRLCARHRSQTQGEEQMTLFLQGIAFGIAFYMMIDFIDWFDEDQA